MNWVDLLLGALVLLGLSGGYRMGFLTRAGSWVGLVGGIVLSVPVVGPAVDLFDGSGQRTRLLVSILVVGGAAMVGQAIGTAFGARLRFGLGRGSGRTLDSLGGAAAGAFGVLVVVWLLLPTLGLVPGEMARAVRSSAIVGLVDENAPEPPVALRDLSRKVSELDFPTVFAGMRPSPETGPPPSQLPLSQAVVDRVTPSTVNVEATGCGRIQEGSGFVVEPGLVVTNAHVVSGTDDVRIRLTDGSTRAGDVVAFDDDRDLALISVGDLGRSPLPLDDARLGEGAAAFGHPGGQDQLRIAPATVEDQIEAEGRDIRDRGRVRRQVVILAAELRSGDSGSAVVDVDGNVIGVVFAVAPDRPSTAYALATSELRAVLGAPRDPATSTGGC